MEQRVCRNCFAEYEGDSETICSVCGWDNRKPEIPEGLRYDTVLNERYRVGRAKAMNGEGITYAAQEITSKKTVDVREFFPMSISRREGVRQEILALPEDEELFEEALDSFLELSKGLSRFRELTAVVSVIDIFQENGTCYVVTRAEPSVTLRRYVERRGGKLSWNDVQHLFAPVLSALGLTNSLGVPHLGLSPDTLRVTKEEHMYLSGFCIPQVRVSGTVIPEELYHGYAAAEQYQPDAPCGEPSDVYALASCMLYALTGETPQDARKRMKDQRLMISKDVLKALPPYAVTALANALQVTVETRISSFERLKAELAAPATVISQIENTDAIRHLPSPDLDIPQNRGLPPVVWLIGSCAVTLVALIVVATMWLGDKGMSFGDIQQIFTSQAATQQTITVPNLVNQSYADWDQQATSGTLLFHLKMSSREFSDTVAEGDIISQSPFSGETIKAGDTLVVTVSKGSAKRTLPEIKGMSFTELADALQKNSFVPVKTEEASADIEAGYVIRYADQKEGASLDYGATVTVVVSTGPAAEPVEEGTETDGTEEW